MIGFNSHEVTTAPCRGRQPTDRTRFYSEPRRGDSKGAYVSLSPLRGCGYDSDQNRGLTPTARCCRHFVARRLSIKHGGQR
ncbi:hypothetical protein LF1_22930 [Rubripirellula obstinata]|uniref:Uncharacterized protein n=1 Tax=Rubripirellula obstinata TaxID=406547 RepID=A0A5B1CGS1_9BACT|nr:hypothetical protein LF1_22930 [Rubripirellula obstinata]